MPKFSEINEISSSSHFQKTEFDNIITLPSTYLHKTKVSTANSSPDSNHITSSFMTQLSDSTPQTFTKTSSDA